MTEKQLLLKLKIEICQIHNCNTLMSKGITLCEKHMEEFMNFTGGYYEFKEFKNK